MDEVASVKCSVEIGSIIEPKSRLTVQKRGPGEPQTVKDAAVYILRLPPPLPGVPPQSLSASILGELRAHLGVLRANPAATLVLIPRFLPEPGSVDPDVEAVARLWDLSRLQLANEREMEMGELVKIVNSVRDNTGWLMVVNKLRSRNSATTAIAVKYQTYPATHHET